MKTLHSVIALFLLASYLSADIPINKSLLAKIAIEGFDCVSYHTDQKAIKGSKTFSLELHGAKWRFSSQENLELFKKNPEKYLPQYGGYCAWAMANGYKAKIDPNAFSIVSNRLYLNYNAKIQSKWEKDRKNLIAKGDSEWVKLITK